ncbi:MAG: c-type cytochrome [Alphaproteobacteria bacterium]|nr:c-type cytochrome [Alphaproteobacteria bacterium]
MTGITASAVRTRLAGLALALSVCVGGTVTDKEAAASDFFTLKGHGGPIMGIAVAPESGRIATASFDNSVGLWTRGQPAWLEDHRAAVNAVAFIDEARAVSAGDDFALVLWDLKAGSGQRLEGHTAKVINVDIAPDRGTIASASWDRRIGLWPILSDGNVGTPRFLTGHQAPVGDIAFSQDGTRLYSVAADGSLRVWDLDGEADNRVLYNHGFAINTVHVDEEAGWIAYGSVDGVTRVIDFHSELEIGTFTLDRRPILAMAVNPDGSLLAVGDGEGYIMVINTRTWEIERDFRATTQGPVWALAFSPDGTNIHAGGLDDALYSWPVASLDEHGRIAADNRTFLEDPKTLPNGERQFKRKCSICHTLTPSSARRAGPTLYNLFGRKAGTVPDYLYSETLDNSDIIWTETTVKALFDIGPDHYIPGTKMPMQVIAAEKDRQDLVDYLRQATQQEDQQQ